MKDKLLNILQELTKPTADNSVAMVGDTEAFDLVLIRAKLANGEELTAVEKELYDKTLEEDRVEREMVLNPKSWDKEEGDDTREYFNRVISLIVAHPDSKLDWHDGAFENDICWKREFCWNCCNGDPLCKNCEHKPEYGDPICFNAPYFFMKDGSFKATWYKHSYRGFEYEGELPDDFGRMVLENINKF